MIEYPRVKVCKVHGDLNINEVNRYRHKDCRGGVNLRCSYCQVETNRKSREQAKIPKEKKKQKKGEWNKFLSDISLKKKQLKIKLLEQESP